MNFKKYLLNEDENAIKDALQLSTPKNNEEYLKEVVLKWIAMLNDAIKLQKNKVMSDTNDEIQLGILNDLLLKTRKWIELYKERWPDDKISNSNLSPVSSKPNQPPIDMNSKMPADMLSKIQGTNVEDKEEPKK